MTETRLILDHVYERALIACRCLQAADGQIDVSDPLETFIDDVKLARPTIFVPVPRLWLKFQQGMWNVVHLQSKLLSPAAEAFHYFIIERGEAHLLAHDAPLLQRAAPAP